MNERKTISMLQRVPVILAVTAASYGLPLQAQAQHVRGAAAGKSVSRPAAFDSERPMHDRRLVRQR
jgi:hypothetical protein